MARARRWAWRVVLALTIIGCGATTATPAPSPATPVPPTSTAEPAASGPTPAVAPTPTLAPSFAGLAVVAALEDDLRIRSRPWIGDDSEQRELIPKGTRLLVLAGPVPGSGYDWYELAPLDMSPSLSVGWVAASSRDGAPWLGPSTYPCPAKPATADQIAAVPGAVGLLCFGGQPITFDGRVTWCNCDVDPGEFFMPGWFARSTKVIVGLDADGPPPVDDALWLLVDPAGHHAVPVPEDKPLTITGLWDHPAASTCWTTPYDSEERVETSVCRLRFVVTDAWRRAPPSPSP